MSKVFVVDVHKHPLDPIHPGWARKLLSSGQAAVYRRYPFTIILKKSVPEPHTTPLRVKIDPGAKTSGLVVVNDANGELVFAAELAHRDTIIKMALSSRRDSRHSRRHRHTRYRKARFQNRPKPKGWLPPSLQSRITNIVTWVERLLRLCPITAISQELERFDTQMMQNSEEAGVTYQPGELIGFEVKEYLLDKWHRTCVYCGATNVPLQVEHMTPRARGGTDHISNLCLACEACNIAKGTQDIQTFLSKKPEQLTRILTHARAPFKDTTSANTTRWALYERLKMLGLPIEVGTGGRTKFNRTKRELPKTRWHDAACVGESTPERLQLNDIHPLLIKATGHGTRQMCQTNKFGFPKQHRQRQKRYFDFQTGDMVRAVIPHGKYVGVHMGRLTVRASGGFKIRTQAGEIPCGYRYCKAIHRSDGYQYYLLAFLAPAFAEKNINTAMMTTKASIRPRNSCK